MKKKKVFNGLKRGAGLNKKNKKNLLDCWQKTAMPKGD